MESGSLEVLCYTVSTGETGARESYGLSDVTLREGKREALSV